MAEMQVYSLFGPSAPPPAGRDGGLPQYPGRWPGRQAVYLGVPLAQFCDPRLGQPAMVLIGAWALGWITSPPCPPSPPLLPAALLNPI